VEVTLTAGEWISIANLFDSAPAPVSARARRRQDRLYDLLWDWREELKTGDTDIDVMHDLPQSYVLLMRGYLADRPARKYHQAGWKQIVRPLLLKLGWEDSDADIEDEDEDLI